MDSEKVFTHREKPIKTKIFRHLASTFAQETTTHGVAQLAKDSSKLRVFVYAVALLASSALLLYILTMSIIRYRSGDSFIEISVVRRKNLTYPSVTFCPLSFYTRDFFESEFGSSVLEEVQELFQFGEFGLWSDVPSRTQVNNETRLMLESYFSTSLHWMYQQSRSAKDTFLCCSLDNTALNCSQYITSLLTDQGVCQTFHSRDVVSTWVPCKMQTRTACGEYPSSSIPTRTNTSSRSS